MPRVVKINMALRSHPRTRANTPKKSTSSTPEQTPNSSPTNSSHVTPEYTVPPAPNNTPIGSPMPSPTIANLALPETDLSEVDHLEVDLPEIQLWQAKVLETTKRTPLPDAPNSRPWESMTPDELKSATKRAREAVEMEKTLKAMEKKDEEQKTRIARKVWTRSDIEKLAGMRERGCGWEAIQIVFPRRSLDGLKQVWWKHKYRRDKLHLGASERRLSSPGNGAYMDVEGEGFDKSGKVKWNFKRTEK